MPTHVQKATTAWGWGGGEGGGWGTKLAGGRKLGGRLRAGVQEP